METTRPAARRRGRRCVPVLAAGTLAIAIAASPARAEEQPATGPCDEVAREAAAQPPPLPIRDSGFGYKRWEFDLEFYLGETWGWTPEATIAGVTPACHA